MRKSTYNKWVLAGYEQFALKGTDGLVIENIALLLGVSKSTFYHHFGNLSFFTDLLLDEHIERAMLVAAEAECAEKFVPDFLAVLLKYKTDILFHQQLRKHRDNSAFTNCFTKAAGSVFKKIRPRWAMFIGLPEDSETTERLFYVIQDVFYHRLTMNDFNMEWMHELSFEIKEIVEQVAGNKVFLDGSVQ